MDTSRTMIRDGAVAVRDGRIVEVGPAAEVHRRWRATGRLGGAGRVVLPGLVNAHQHLTGDRLVSSTIPDSIPSQQAIFDWAVPLHVAHTADDDELSATLGLVDAATTGITFTVEAGTVGHPERVLAAYDRVGVGGTLGSWGSDAAGLPFAGDVPAVLDRQRQVLELTAGHPRRRRLGDARRPRPDVRRPGRRSQPVGRRHGTGLTFHLSPTDADATAYLARTGRRPVVHLDALGVLGQHVLIAHGVHVDDAELDTLLRTNTALAYCPWAYLRLGQGVTAPAATPSSTSAADGWRSAATPRTPAMPSTCSAPPRSPSGWPETRAPTSTRFAAHTALELATIAGAHAIGMGDEIGSLEVGKRADVVVVDTTGPNWAPPSADPVLGLVWGGGRSGRE